MKIDSPTPIRSMKELNEARAKLRLEIASQEVELVEHPFVSIPLALIDRGSVKETLHESMEALSLGNYKNALLGLVGTFLLANRKTRKFFIAFMVAKELVPFLVHKINEAVKKPVS
jgi:hypothetical protein